METTKNSMLITSSNVFYRSLEVMYNLGNIFEGCFIELCNRNWKYSWWCIIMAIKRAEFFVGGPKNFAVPVNLNIC